MVKATHNGTCQVCGRAQAHKGDGLAKHGYTVPHGWFQGTCSGSGKLPVELDTTVLDATVAFLTTRGRELKVTTEQDVTEVTVTWRAQIRDRNSEQSRVVRSAEEADALNRELPTWASRRDWLDLRKSRAWALQQQGHAMLDHAAMLAALKAARHGQPLVERKTRN